MKLVRWIDLIRKAQHRVLEGEERSGVDVELDVQVDGSATAVLGMQVDFPRLAKRVRLDKVTLVMDVKSVRHRMVLEVCDEPSDVNCGHWSSG